MGAVYRGTQRSVDREVAIKVVSPQLMADPEMIKRFLREARLASRINHPNAVGVLDFGQTADGVFYLVMELVAGRTLEAILRTETRLDAERTALIGAQICHALEGAHAVPIVHRDLKPANVIVDANDFVKVLDFGIAKSLSPDTISSTMTNAGAVMGTPGFMPPEVGLGRACDERSDLYSLGCILYLTVSGRLPFEADTLPEILMKHANDPVPPLVDVPPGLASVILKMLEKTPADRHHTATEARLALEATIKGSRRTPTPWAAPNPVQRPEQRSSRREVDTVPARPELIEAPTVPRKNAAPPVHARETLRPPPARRAWPWVLAVLVASGGAAAFFAIDPFGGSRPPDVESAAPSEPVVAPSRPTVTPAEPASVGPTMVAPAQAVVSDPPAVPAQPGVDPPAVAPEQPAVVDPRVIAPAPPVAVAPPAVAPAEPIVDETAEIEMPVPPPTTPPIKSATRPAMKPKQAARPATKPAKPATKPVTKPVANQGGGTEPPPPF